MTNWKNCEYYQDMYEIRNTWGKLTPCEQGDYKPDTCDGCQLFNGCNSKDMLCQHETVKIELETANVALLNLKALRDLTTNYPEYKYKKDINKYISELEREIKIEREWAVDNG